MLFRIAITFTDSLARLTSEEQKQVKLTVFDLQQDPSSPGHSFHKLTKARDTRFWSVRVSGDIRIIVHRMDDSMLVCYVDHHDKAYDWAERRKLTVHPKTGAAQIVEVRESVEVIVLREYISGEAQTRATASKPAPQPLASVSTDTLLSYGVPLEWIADLHAADDAAVLAIAEHLPAEAAEAVLELATGGTPRAPEPISAQHDPFEHPDALRRFRVITEVTALQAALEYPWERWTVFLHPDQRQLVQRAFAGPARVAGSAGTGKTIVALHRAAHLARQHPDARILLTTFSDTLAAALRTKLRRLLAGEPRLGERIDVHSLGAIGERLYVSNVGPVALATRAQLLSALNAAAVKVEGHRFTAAFLRTEWEHVVDAWQLSTWEEYRDVARLGRKTRLPEAQRRTLWDVFAAAQSTLKAQNVATESQLFTRLAEALRAKEVAPFDHVVVDESQDLSVAHLRFLAALGGTRPDGLFFAGDLGQRIFQQPFSWKSLGVDVRGRSKTLRVNYRTSHQIRQHADRLLGPVIGDVDGNEETRSDTISVFNGPPPRVQVFGTAVEESQGVAKWIRDCLTAGMLPHEIGVFVRSAAQIERAQSAILATGATAAILDEHVDTRSGQIAIGTMHYAKGLEFRAVAVMACDDDILPLQERIASVGDEGDLKDVYETERHLLYVACTRARDQLLISAARPASEFLDDLLSATRD